MTVQRAELSAPNGEFHKGPSVPEAGVREGGAVESEDRSVSLFTSTFIFCGDSTCNVS